MEITFLTRESAQQELINCLHHSNKQFAYICKDYPTIKMSAWKDILSKLKANLINRLSPSYNKIELKNSSSIQFFSARFRESLCGFTFDGVVIDCEMNDDLERTILGILIAKNGWLIRVG